MFVDFTYFINSTVHTSKVIWVLKTIKSYWMTCTDDTPRGSTAPSSGREGKNPHTRSEGNRLAPFSLAEAACWSGTWFVVQVRKTKWRELIPDQRLCCKMRLDVTDKAEEDRLIQATLPRSPDTEQKQLLLNIMAFPLNTVRISQHMALLTELFTWVNKTFGTKYLYRNANWNNHVSLFLLLTLYNIPFL